MDNVMGYLLRLSAASELVAWAAPLGIVALATLIGWISERLIIVWVRGLARRSSHARESVVARTLRGHITFWGFLLGLGIDSPFIVPALPESLRSWYPDALLALFITSLTILMARLAVGLVRLSAASSSRPVISLITNVVWFITLVIGFLLVLSLLQVNITPWLTTLGVAGLAVSLALQATLTDLISGMLLLGSRQVAIGDYVKLSSGEEGYITDITWRTTTIRQLSNNEIIIPNAKMTQTSVTNYNAPRTAGSVSVPVHVSYDSDLERVERVTIEVARDVMRTVEGGVPDFEPLIRYNTLGPYSIRFSVIMQHKEFTAQSLITHEFIKRLYARYSQEGITIPNPIQTVRLSEASAAPAEVSGAMRARGSRARE
jgi:small-conductance mechanosensitive channel